MNICVVFNRGQQVFEGGALIDEIRGNTVSKLCSTVENQLSKYKK